MFPKINNIISYRNNNNNSIKPKDNFKTAILNNNYYKNKKNSKKDIKISNILKSEKNINKTKSRIFSSENIKLENINNINTINKKKPNNVTNNICIIIKTVNNKETGNEKVNYNLGYLDSFRDSQNQSNSIISDINLTNSNISQKFKNKKLESYFENKKTNNNSFQKNKLNKNKKNSNKKKLNVRNYKQKEYNDISNKIDYYFKNNSIKYRNKNISNINTKTKLKNSKLKNINGSIDNKNSKFKQMLFSGVSEKDIEINEAQIISPIKRPKKNKYKESIQFKKELLGINLNIKEKNEVNKKINDEYIDYDKEKAEIERKILLNDVIIRNEYNKYKIKKPKRILSCDIYDKSIEKIKRKSIDSTFIIDNNISKSDISYIPTEYNKNKNKDKDDIKKRKYSMESNSFVNRYESQKMKKNNKHRSNLNFTKSINYFNIDKKYNKLITNNNSFINSKSYLNLFIKEEKMKRNISIILKDIKKLINKSKNNNNNNNMYKSQKKTSRSLFSSPKNEKIIIQNTEDGKILRCIKKLSKEKSRIQIKRVKSNKKFSKELSKDLLDYIIDKKDDNIIKEENKKVKINIPGEEIKALKRIKLKIENFKKNKIYRNKNYRKLKSFSYFTNQRSNNILNKHIIKRLNTLTIENKNKKISYLYL